MDEGWLWFGVLVAMVAALIGFLPYFRRWSRPLMAVGIPGTMWRASAVALVVNLSVLAAEASHATATNQDCSSDALAQLRILFGKDIEFHEDHGPRVEYCPDNTCDSFATKKKDAAGDLTQFSLIYLLFVDQSWSVEQTRKAPTPEWQHATLAALDWTRDLHCEAEQRSLTVKCILRTLAKRGGITVTFVRYDENHRNEAPMSLEDDLARLQP